MSFLRLVDRWLGLWHFSEGLRGFRLGNLRQDSDMRRHRWLENYGLPISFLILAARGSVEISLMDNHFNLRGLPECSGLSELEPWL